MAQQVHKSLIERAEADVNRLRCDFQMILNPKDKEDEGIIDCIRVPSCGEELNKAEEFSERVSLLLKHDWERAKREAGSIRLLKGLVVPLRRTKYKNYHNGKRKKCGGSSHTLVL